MKTALITGAGGGLGYELARMHAEAGWRVFALSRSMTPRMRTLAEARPEMVDAIQCDIGSTESVERAVAAVHAKAERLDRIFNNAGIHRFADWVTLEDSDLDFCAHMFDINAVGPLRVVKAALPMLGEGSVIVNISSEAASIAGTHGVINYAYSMSKAGMNMGARMMDNWLCGRGIRTIMIHPGRMRTGMKGAHSDIDPWETAEALMRLADGIRAIPEDRKFMDYRGNPLEW